MCRHNARACVLVCVCVGVCVCVCAIACAHLLGVSHTVVGEIEFVHVATVDLEHTVLGVAPAARRVERHAMGVACDGL
jgi:hypothetical protein